MPCDYVEASISLSLSLSLALSLSLSLRACVCVTSELAVLRGAQRAIAAGHVPVILLEYGDKMSPSIHHAMKRSFSAAAAAPVPALLTGGSLYGLQRLASRFGYDAFLIGTLGWRRRGPQSSTPQGW